MSSQAVTASKLENIIQSQMFAALSVFEPCRANCINDRVNFLIQTLPSNVLDKIIRAYDSIQVQINQTVKEVNDWELPRRFQQAGLWYKFGKSDFNLLFALLQKHVEIIAANRDFARLFVDKISLCSKSVRTLMSPYRFLFYSTLNIQPAKSFSKPQFAANNLLQVLNARQRFSNITSVKLHFSYKFTGNDLIHLFMALHGVARNSTIEELFLSSDALSQPQIEKYLKNFKRCREEMSSFFQSLTSLQILKIRDEIPGDLFRKLLKRGLCFPKKLFLLRDQNLFNSGRRDLCGSVTYLSYHSAQLAVGWGGLRHKMAYFPQLQHLNLACSGVVSEDLSRGDFKMHQEGFSELMLVIPKLVSLTVENRLFLSMLDDITCCHEEVPQYDDIIVQKMSEIFICGILKCKSVRDLKLAVYGSVEYLDFVSSVMRCIHSTLPNVQVCITDDSEYLKKWNAW